MSQYLLTISPGEEAFVRKLLQKLPGVQLKKMKAKPAKKPLTPEQQEWVDDLKQSLLEAEAALRGEIQLKSFEEMMQELRAEHEAHWGPEQ